MTKPKRGVYYYIIRIWAIFFFPIALAALVGLKLQFLSDTLLTNFGDTIKSLFLVGVEMYYISEIFKFGEGYTMVGTTKYNLFRCRESGTDEAFMMFADTEEELALFFEYTKPNKTVFIEPAEMTGKSIEMKIFNREYEERDTRIGGI